MKKLLLIFCVLGAMFCLTPLSSIAQSDTTKTETPETPETPEEPEDPKKPEKPEKPKKPKGGGGPIIFEDSLLWFNRPGSFIGSIDRTQFTPGGGFTLATPTTFTPISQSLSPQLKLPKAVKVSSKPITLKKDAKCLTFRCAQDCNACKLYWWDRNQDGKVQPRRELRCACTREKTCKIQVRQEENCKD